MANDSSTGGYLAPAVTTPPQEDADLDAILQTMIVGIVGLAGSFVRPRWQPVMPKIPEPSVNWCAIGVTDQQQDANPAMSHDPAAGDTLIRHEAITALASFYGPQGQRNAGVLRDGLYIAQNREGIRAYGLALIDTSSITTVPELVNQQWLKRYDVKVNLRRIINRLYPVLNLATATETIIRN